MFEVARELAAEHDVDIATDVRLGDPSRAIVKRADDFDAVVLGSHGGSLVDRLLIGNVAKSVFRNSPVPVIVAR